MPQFSINKSFANQGDVLRSYNWQMTFDASDLFGPGVTVPDLTLRCRSTNIPGRSNDAITSNFMGMKMHFAGKVEFTNPFTVTFEEFEDRKVSKALYNWQQKIFEVTNDGAGSVTKLESQGYSRVIQLQLYNYKGQAIPKTENGIVYLRNAWVQNVEQIALAYEASDSVKYSASFQYDTWDYGTK